MVYDLINKAIEYTTQLRYEFENYDLGLIEPLDPIIRREILYLRIREYIYGGSRKAVRVIPENWKRSVAYSILIRVLVEIFHYGKTAEIVNLYNGLLDDMIGTH